MLQCLFIIWSSLNVQCEEIATGQPFIYNRYGHALVNFFTRKEWSYVGCMKHCQNMGGRSPSVRRKRDVDLMKAMLANLRAFPPFPKYLFLSVTRGESREYLD